MNPPLLRLLDANANRAREALRVVEDYARFVLDDKGMSLSLKELRHELAGATRPFLADAILHRDTPGDVGTGNKTAAELQRQDVADIVTAAGKRLGEALRAIEECLKVLSPTHAPRVEAIRYRFYHLEQQLAYTLHPTPGGFESVRLYVLITEAVCQRPWLEAAEEAILGGADCLQLREKGLDGGELLARARLLVRLCGQYDVPCIINDRPDIAILSGAAGVHLGQDDLPARVVRKLVGREMIVGVSTHQIEQARQAVLDGADYVGVGPMFPSATKPRDFVAGPAYARAAAGSVPIPVVAIGGITARNVDEVLKTGAPTVAVTAAVLGRADVRAAARELKAKLVTAAVGRADVRAAAGELKEKLLRAAGAAGAGLADRPSLSLSSVGQTFLSVSSVLASPPLETELKIARRHLPHWTLEGSTYFLTFRVRSGTLSKRERQIVLDHVKAGHDVFYDLLGTVVMPDHAHLILRPRPGITLPRITKGTKGATARLVNQARGQFGYLWQDESWDRILRDQDELDEKMKYILDNPVRAGLVQDGWDYDAIFINEEKD